MEIKALAHLTTPIMFFGISLAIRAVLAFLETSITALRLFTLKELAQTVNKYHGLFHHLEKNPHRILITILLASSVADVISASLATYIAETVCAHFQLSSEIGFSVGVGIASIAIVLFGEIIPKNIAKSHNESIFKSMLWLINLLYYLLYPIINTLMLFSNLCMKKISGISLEQTNNWISSEREIQFLIGYTHEKGLMDPSKTQMLKNIFELGNTPVRDIMVPATDVILLDVHMSLKEAFAIFSKHPFTRLPVYQDKPDNIIGMVHQKDLFLLLSRNEDISLKEILRSIMFTPESVKINQLLNEFRHRHMHISIVLNEHGSVTGLITLEDILEQIVGDINDEHEPIHEKVISLQKGGWLVDASLSLEDLENLLKIHFKRENSVTLGGFLTEYLQHIPKKGDRILYHNYFFQVQHASNRRVKQVLIFNETPVIHKEQSLV